MATDPTPLLLEEGRALADAIAAALPRWVEASLRSRAPALDDREVAATVALVAESADAELSALLGTDPDRQRNTPLAVLRAAMAPVAEVLGAHGVPAPRRDPVEERLEPADRYALGPRSWAELGDEVAAAAVRWGAAKAFVHRHRHGPPPSGP